MKMNKKKCIVFLIILVLFSIGISKIVFADNLDLNAYDDVSGPLDESTKDAMSIGLRVVRIVAAGIAVISLLILAIKYITSAPEGRATSKKALLIYAIGLFLVVSGTELIEVIADIMK